MELTIIRDITTDECPWLNETIKKGARVFKYVGCTYGVVSDNGIAVTIKKDTTPFLEVPIDAVQEDK